MEEADRRGLANAFGGGLWIDLSHDGVQALSIPHCVPQDLTYLATSNFGLRFGLVVNELNIPWLTFRRLCVDGERRELPNHFGERCPVCSVNFSHTPSLSIMDPQVDECILEQLSIDPLGALIVVPAVRDAVAAFWASPPPVERRNTRIMVTS